MTVLEMTYEFEKVLSTIDSDFLHKERPDTSTMVMCLNITQERLFLAKYLNSDNYKERLVNFNKYYDEIKSLVNATSIVLTNSTNYAIESKYLASNGTTYSLLHTTSLNNLTGYVGLIDIYLNTTGGVNTTSSGLSGCIYKDFIEFKNFLINQNNIPILPRPVFTINGSDIVVTRDKYTTTNGTALINYVRKPKYMALSVADSNTQTDTCQLASYLHEALVQSAVSLYIADYKQYSKPKQQQEQKPQ